MCTKSCLNLGYHAFKEKERVINDPLFERFKDETIVSSYHEERKPLKDVIDSKLGEYYRNDEGFLSFPPSLLPDDKMKPGFPREVAQLGNSGDEEWKRMVADKNAEDIVVRSFTSALKQSQTKGFLLHSYRTESYLQHFIVKAKQQRKSTGVTDTSRLLPLESLASSYTRCNKFHIL